KGDGDVVLGAQSAAELARHAGSLDNAPDAVAVDGAALFGAVEVHEVKVGGPLLDPTPGHRGGVGAEDGFAVIVALPQPHTLPATQVDGRKNQHRDYPSKSGSAAGTVRGRTTGGAGDRKCNAMRGTCEGSATVSGKKSPPLFSPRPLGERGD